jgi:dinuclear metal center YbgI/SA1388 family protein
MPKVAEIVEFLQRFAPSALAEDWDNVGLILGDRSTAVSRALTCLTLTPDVAREALDAGATLVVTHHPVLFRAVKRITSDSAEGRMLADLMAARVAVYSPHTAYDSAAEGINRQLAELFGLSEIEPLRQGPSARSFKIVCFVPRDHLAAVQEALWSAGAGKIGEYSKCGFVLDGTGSFLGSDAANPAVGQAGRLEHVAEARLEVICGADRISGALAALRSAHPYEEPAYDVYPLEPQPAGIGAGRVGRLASAADAAACISLGEFCRLVREKLRIGSLQFVGDPNQPVRRVGIACGAGGDFLNDALAKWCDVLVTGEARFHTCLEARTAGIGLVLAGHYATERPAIEHLAGVLSRAFPDLAVHASRVEHDPLQWL